MFGSARGCPIEERMSLGIPLIAESLYDDYGFFEIEFAELCHCCLHVLVYAEVAEREYHHVP